MLQKTEAGPRTGRVMTRHPADCLVNDLLQEADSVQRGIEISTADSD